MANEESSSITDTICLVFRAMRYLLVTLNLIVLIVAIYFLISGNNFAGESLQMVFWLRVLLSIAVILTSIYGIICALWNGKSTKFHLKMIGVYLALALLIAILGSILAAVYVRKPAKADVTFIVLTVVVGFFITMSSLAFAYALKKTKLLRRLNVLSSS